MYPSGCGHRSFLAVAKLATSYMHEPWPHHKCLISSSITHGVRWLLILFCWSSLSIAHLNLVSIILDGDLRGKTACLLIIQALGKITQVLLS
jgi:hypothetical protein